GGHVRADDPEAARFSFGRAPAATVTDDRPPTPEGLPAPRMDGTLPPLPGRQVATVPPRRRRWVPGWRRGLLLGTLAIVLLFSFWLYLGYRSFSNEVAHANKRLDNRTKAALTPTGNILTTPSVTLVLGSDSRGGNTTARADSILLVRTDPGKHLLTLLSIPRDLRVPIPGHGDDKINSAFAYGGSPLLIRTINRLTGFKVNHIVLVDFKGFISLINSMGGVTITNPTRVDSSEKFGGKLWHFAKGPITLNGRNALAFARIRKTTNPQDSDITRTARQQLVMQAIAHQLVSATSILHLPQIGRDIARPLATDLSANELLGMGWIKFRSSRTLECHLGGTPQLVNGQDVILGSEQNRSIVQMFLGEQAPLPAPKGQIYDPGCLVK
ncbi:MAG: polyisoprenyl-teichoic acid--peptidoglycan teichoic acid transferase, partial [Gaiellales bacterium]|nr:polyisoprenyl-teichoic acid--peptidoglycan teichoic acid transferase [Gaiellales bacterium]